MYGKVGGAVVGKYAKTCVYAVGWCPTEETILREQS